MRHLKGRRKLNRTGSHRIAMFRNMATSLLRHERITTTDPKAKELRRIVDRIITLGKRVPVDTLTAGSEEERKDNAARRVHAYRLARRWVVDRDVLHRVFNEYSERYRDRPGGYTRIVKLGFRPGDNAPLSMIELVSEASAAGADVLT